MGIPKTASFCVGGLLGYALWLVPYAITGRLELWDSGQLAWWAGLSCLGLAAGLVARLRVVCFALGVALGQLCYLLAHPGAGPLLAPGALYLFAGTAVFTLSTAALLRKVAPTGRTAPRAKG